MDRSQNHRSNIADTYENVRRKLREGLKVDLFSAFDAGELRSAEIQELFVAFPSVLESEKNRSSDKAKRRFAEVYRKVVKHTVSEELESSFVGAVNQGETMVSQLVAYDQRDHSVFHDLSVFATLFRVFPEASEIHGLGIRSSMLDNGQREYALFIPDWDWRLDPIHFEYTVTDNQQAAELQWHGIPVEWLNSSPAGNRIAWSQVVLQDPVTFAQTMSAAQKVYTYEWPLQARKILAQSYRSEFALLEEGDESVSL